MGKATNNWIEAYETQKEIIASYTSPPAPPAPPIPSHVAENDSLNRLQIMLLWLASILIAVTLYTQIITRFG